MATLIWWITNTNQDQHFVIWVVLVYCFKICQVVINNYSNLFMLRNTSQRPMAILHKKRIKILPQKNHVRTCLNQGFAVLICFDCDCDVYFSDILLIRIRSVTSFSFSFCFLFLNFPKYLLLQLHFYCHILDMFLNILDLV